MVWLEFIKLVAQLAGALLVARFAVSWALDRYKREKLWERRLNSYADVVAALGEMLRVNSEWYEEAITHRNEEKASEREIRYKTAKLKLNEVSAVGQLLLPPRAQVVLRLLESDLNLRPRHDTYQEALEWQADILTKALDEMIELGRADVTVSARNSFAPTVDLAEKE